jgi:hypothetical protein
MNTGSRDEMQFLADVRGIRKALERIAAALEKPVETEDES